MSEAGDGGDRGVSGGRGDETSALWAEHGPMLGRVAMALLGDVVAAERALESAAREAAERGRPVANRVPPSADPRQPEAEVFGAFPSPRAWLAGLVRAAAANRLSKLPLRVTSAVTGPLPASATAPLAKAHATERLGATFAGPAREALAVLRPTEREAVILAIVGGLDAAEVAAACGTDVGTAKTRIARGLEQLMDRGTNSSSGGSR